MRRLLTALVASLFVACSMGDAAEPVPSPAPAKEEPGSAASSLTTYHEHVAPIFQKHCLGCHVSGGIAPFALTSYAESAPMASAVVDMTAQRIMPPWGANDTADCKVTRPWQNDLRLSDDELATLKAWNDAGAPEGDPSKAPAPVNAVPTTLEDPSLSLKSDTGFAMSGTVDRLRCFVLDPKISALSFVDGTQVVPEQPGVVHHVLVFVDPTGASRAKADANGQYDCFGGAGVDGARLLTAWAPGAAANVLPSGIAMPIEANALLVMQVHYHAAPGVEAPPDHTSVQLRFAKDVPQRIAFTQLIGNFRDQNTPGRSLVEPPFEIAPNEKDHFETMKLTIPTEFRGRPTGTLRLLGAAGHMHYVGVSEEIRVKRAASTEEECLLAIPRWDFDWQRSYRYDVPFEELPTMTAGDELSIKCRYDNTMGNPKMARALKESGQTAPQQVLLGESTLEEMCLGAFVFVLSP